MIAVVQNYTFVEGVFATKYAGFDGEFELCFEQSELSGDMLRARHDELRQAYARAERTRNGRLIAIGDPGARIRTEFTPEFAGYDAGYFGTDLNKYSLILNYLSVHAPDVRLNARLLLETLNEAESLIERWKSDPEPDKERFLPDEVPRPVPIFIQAAMI